VRRAVDDPGRLAGPPHHVADHRGREAWEDPPRRYAVLARAGAGDLIHQPVGHRHEPAGDGLALLDPEAPARLVDVAPLPRRQLADPVGFVNSVVRICRWRDPAISDRR
jgi:hypothetical protein